MCTAISFRTNAHYFGRNLDLPYHYDEAVVITPRNFPFLFREYAHADTHYAMIGIATVSDGSPLYYDAVNECGLGIAALNFPGNAVYHDAIEGFCNIASFELIPFVLSCCQSVEEARELLENVNITNTPFSHEFQPSPLHWIVSDRNRSITVESTAEGLMLYDNPYGILTNNPPFPYHCANIKNYLHLTSEQADNTICPGIELESFSNGIGAFGLPGDMSSGSRFIRAVFHKYHAVRPSDENESLCQMFHILDAVAQIHGCVKTKEGLQKTLYSSCCNTDAGIYYYTTYDNPCIHGVYLHKGKEDGDSLECYPLKYTPEFHMENA